MEKDDDFKKVTLNNVNQVLSKLDTVSMPEEDRYKDWEKFSAHGAITSMYDDPLYSRERLALQKMHYKLLLSAFYYNFDAIFNTPKNINTIKAINTSLEHILKNKDIHADDIVPAANSITMLTKLIKPADI